MLSSNSHGRAPRQPHSTSIAVKRELEAAVSMACDASHRRSEAQATLCRTRYAVEALRNAYGADIDFHNASIARLQRIRLEHLKRADRARSKGQSDEESKERLNAEDCFQKWKMHDDALGQLVAEVRPAEYELRVAKRALFHAEKEFALAMELVNEALSLFDGGLCA